MDLQYLRRLLKILDESSASEIEIEEEGTKIRVAKRVAEAPVAVPQYTAIHAAPAVAAPPPVHAPAAAAPEPAPAPQVSNLHEIKSPIVGTFYKSASPDAPAFAEVGKHVNKGDTLCIIEAMKLMNEIESDISGTVEKIMTDNAAPVEYNQVLFLIKPD